VSNAAFTRAARSLAAAAGVLLLHHEELQGLERRIEALDACDIDVMPLATLKQTS